MWPFGDANRDLYRPQLLRSLVAFLFPGRPHPVPLYCLMVNFVAYRLCAASLKPQRVAIHVEFGVSPRLCNFGYINWGLHSYGHIGYTGETVEFFRNVVSACIPLLQYGDFAKKISITHLSICRQWARASCWHTISNWMRPNQVLRHVM
jgi:hypothetical protein